ncbi:hypothetical protein M3Y99_01078000 [Aphelenchoides fujianensis]|nr:hypothetical protein M3Y99_01078000 [Aphelenchoides fujianensis]
MLTIKPRLCTRLPCVLLAVALLVIFVLVFVSEPNEIDHYLPTHALANIKMHKAETFNVLRRKLQRAHPQRVFRQPVKHVYPRRKNMEECRPLFGRVGIFVAVNSDHDKRLYKIAQASLKCYLKSTNYSYFYVDVDKDERTRGLCNQSNIYYKRHCVGSYYLKDVDWMLFLDGDIGVVNPDHCIEEWIDDRVDMIFYERFFNWEIMAGSYLMRNTEQSRQFMLEWAEMEGQQFDGFTGYDNGVLQAYDYVTCCKLQLGAARVFPGSVRIYRRAHGWARDGQLTGNHWSTADFMHEIPDPAECGEGLSGWKWLEEKKTTVQKNRERLAAFEKGVAKGYPKEGRDIPHLIEPDVRECYPDCDRFT